MSHIPELPGTIIPKNSGQGTWLRNQVAALCKINRDRYPGSQPVSFGKKDLERLEKADFWVCEKSDGLRILLVILTNLETSEQIVCIVDRHNVYREISGLFFPHYEHPERPLRSTVVDAELVIDVDPLTKRETLRLLCFDCLVVDDQNIMSKTLDKRYGRLKEHVSKPYAKMLRDHPHMAERQPFDIQVKEVMCSYSIDKVFLDIPKLQHGNDGLIYTSVSTEYIPGTDRNILKWKPPSENSIDFKLVLRFPPLAGSPTEPDLHAKPIFALHAWNGGEAYEPWDTMHVDDDEWESLKAGGEQIDDRIVEVHWDPIGEHWRMMRFRDDKPHGNHRSIVEDIVQSIVDGVEKDTLLARSAAIKNAWKTRLGQPQLPPPPQKSNGPGPAPPSSFPTSVFPASNTQPRVFPKEDLSPLPLRYGPLAQSPWSKVSGPMFVAGMSR